MQELWDLLLSLPYRFAYAIIDFLQWLLNLIPAPSFSLQTYFNGLDPALLGLLSAINFFSALAIVASAFGVRAILMIFGR